MTRPATRAMGQLRKADLLAGLAPSALADLAIGDLPDEARTVRMLGCPDTRQFEVLELGYQLFIREVATLANPVPGPWVGRLWAGDLIKALAVDVLKANDGVVE